MKVKLKEMKLENFKGIRNLNIDFDGIDTTPRGLENISKLPYLIEEMQKNHFNDDIIAKIFQNNGKRWLNSMFF